MPLDVKSICFLRAINYVGHILAHNTVLYFLTAVLFHFQCLQHIKYVFANLKEKSYYRNTNILRVKEREEWNYFGSMKLDFGAKSTSQLSDT